MTGEHAGWAWCYQCGVLTAQGGDLFWLPYAKYRIPSEPGEFSVSRLRDAAEDARGRGDDVRVHTGLMLFLLDQVFPTDDDEQNEDESS